MAFNRIAYLTNALVDRGDVLGGDPRWLSIG